MDSSCERRPRCGHPHADTRRHRFIDRASFAFPGTEIPSYRTTFPGEEREIVSSCGDDVPGEFITWSAKLDCPGVDGDAAVPFDSPQRDVVPDTVVHACFGRSYFDRTTSEVGVQVEMSAENLESEQILLRGTETGRVRVKQIVELCVCVELQ